MMTEIHAKPANSRAAATNGDGSCSSSMDDGPLSKKHAVDKKAQDKKKEKLIKEKKRILKRL